MHMAISYKGRVNRKNKNFAILQLGMNPPPFGGGVHRIGGVVSM